MTEPVAPAPVRAVRRRRTRLYVLLTILILLVAYTGTDWYAGRKLDAEFARLEAKYGSLRVVSETSPVPVTENRARLARAAEALVLPLDMQQAAWSEVQNGFDSGAPISVEVRKWVESNRRALALAAEFPTRPKSNWQYPAGDNVPLLGLRTLSTLIYVSAILELDAHQTEAAVKTTVVGLSLSASLSQERQLIAQLIRIALADKPMQLIQRLLRETEPSKSSLEDLARALAENRDPDPAVGGLTGEMNYYSASLSAAERGRSSEGAQSWGPLARLGRPFLRLMHVKYLQNMDQLITAQAGPRPRQKSPIIPPVSRFSPYYLLRIAMPGLERAMLSSDDYTSQFVAAETAVALRRYKLDHGEYPGDLNALVPAYLDKLGINPFTGKPPAYERTAKGYVLHSPREGSGYSPKKLPLPDWQIDR